MQLIMHFIFVDSVRIEVSACDEIFSGSELSVAVLNSKQIGYVVPIISKIVILRLNACHLRESA